MSRKRALGAPQQEKKRHILKNTGFADRLSTAAAAKKAQLEKFEPKTTVVDPAFVSRQARKAAELKDVRTARAELRATTLQARSDAEAAVIAAAHQAEQEALDAKRQDRKLRKTARKVDADVRRQDRRDALQAYTRAAAE